MVKKIINFCGKICYNILKINTKKLYKNLKKNPIVDLKLRTKNENGKF